VWSPSADRHLGPASAERSVELVAEAAHLLGRHFVRVDTNLRVFTDPRIRWTELHSSGFASIGLALSGAFDVAMFGGIFDGLMSMRPNGDLPASLWSTECVRVVDYGTTTLKLDKIRRVASSPVALDRLKVCLQGDTPLNCGRCEKCYRTMGILYAIGALDRCPTFERPFEPEQLASTPMTNAGARTLVEQLLVKLGDSPREMRIRRSLEASLKRGTALQRTISWLTESISQIDKTHARGALRRAYRAFR
jgi:hypothetical protein